MKVHSIELDDTGLPSDIKVTMTIAEVALIVRHTGSLSPATGGTETSSDMYDVLTGDVINRFYEDGINDVEVGA